MHKFYYLAILSLFFFSCKTTSIISEKEYSFEKHTLLQKSFKSTDGTIKYIDRGAGEVIMLVHGVPTSSWLYRKMTDGLVQSGYRVIVPDMLGFGNSDNPKGYEIYSQEAHAKRIIELADHLDIDQWTHVFHDAGGLWTWELCRIAPERISKMIILNTIIYAEGFHPPVKMKPGAFSKFVMWLYENGVTTNSLLRSLFKVGLKENNLSDTDIEGYKRPLRNGKTEGMYYFFSQTCNVFPDYSKVIEGSKTDALVIWGKHDEMLQWDPQKKKVIQTLQIKDENIHLIDAKHFIQEEKPGLINSLILDFLKDD